VQFARAAIHRRDLLPRAEGFTDIRFVKAAAGATVAAATGRGEIDFGMN
jgi:hypothetical protein